MKKLIKSLPLILTLFVSLAANAQEWKDVAPIFYNNCATCHRPGEIGDGYIYATSYKSLVSDPFGYFTLIPDYINSNLMPPWKADAQYTHFLDERILTQTQKDLITDWVNAGAPAGDTTLAPPSPVFPTSSQLGVPDLILPMTQSYTVPGDNQDHYMCFVLPTNLLADQNISAIEFRPGNGAAVHHCFLYFVPDSTAVFADQQTPEYGYPSFGGAGDGVNADFLGLYGPGLIPRFYPDSSGTKFTAGGFMVIQVHYAPTAVSTTDQSSVNLFFNNQPNIRKVYAKRIGESNITNPPFTIYANEIDTFYSEFSIIHDYSLFAIAPHQHLLGKSYKIWAITPTMDSIPLISIPQWDFHWQMLYSYPFMIKLPVGTTIHARAVYDNTTNNPNNPNNPPVNVHYGESSFDEMFKYFINLLDYLPGDESIVIDSTWGLPTSISPVDGIVSTPQLYPASPDPVREQTVISFYLPSAEHAELMVYNLSGMLMTQPEISSTSGFHRIILDVSKWNQGSYFFTLKTSDKIITKRFIIQR